MLNYKSLESRLSKSGISSFFSSFDNAPIEQTVIKMLEFGMEKPLTNIQKNLISEASSEIGISNSSSHRPRLSEEEEALLSEISKFFTN